MPESADDERLQSLQRSAYGAAASDAERAAAMAELEAMRHKREAAATRTDAEQPVLADADRPEAAAHATATRSARTLATSPLVPRAPGPRTTDLATSARRIRWTIAVGTAALLIGVAVGWQAGTRTAMSSDGAGTVGADGGTAGADGAADGAPETLASLEPRTMAEYLATLPVADETPAAAVFARPATTDDVPAGEPTVLGYGSLEFRLLATQSDGLRIYAGRTGAEFCLYATFVAGGAAATCTVDGRFPEAGLRLTGSINPDGSGVIGSSVDATWHPDGSLQLHQPTE